MNNTNHVEAAGVAVATPAAALVTEVYVKLRSLQRVVTVTDQQSIAFYCLQV